MRFTVGVDFIEHGPDEVHAVWVDWNGELAHVVEPWLEQVVKDRFGGRWDCVEFQEANGRGFARITRIK